MAAIRKLSVTCEFGDFLHEALRDKLVCGISGIRIRKRLLVEKDLTLNKATEVSKSLEGIENEIKEMGSVVTPIGIKEENAFQFKRARKFKTRCYRCNDDNRMQI